MEVGDGGKGDFFVGSRGRVRAHTMYSNKVCVSNMKKNGSSSNLLDTHNAREGNLWLFGGKFVRLTATKKCAIMGAEPKRGRTL